MKAYIFFQNCVRVFVQHIDIVCYFSVIVIFYCANTTAFHMPDWNFRKGVDTLSWFAKWVAA